MENKTASTSSMDQASKNKSGESMMHKVGDAIEKVGHKIADAGAPALGQKIHDMGDKIEKQHKNPNHPHKV